MPDWPLIHIELFPGDRFLSDYEVAVESLEISKTEKSNHSQAVVTLVLRRQVHILLCLLDQQLCR